MNQERTIRKLEEKANELSSRKQHSKALLVTMKAVSINPNDKFIYRNWAVILQKTRKTQRSGDQICEGKSNQYQELRYIPTVGLSSRSPK